MQYVVHVAIDLVLFPVGCEVCVGSDDLYHEYLGKPLQIIEGRYTTTLARKTPSESRYHFQQLIKRSGRSTMSELAKGCAHFLEYRQAHGLQSFNIIYKYLVKPSTEARKLKVRCQSINKTIL